mmetsp:Transcript_22935/g.64448  ORF Transcript_22935/g.64448 Transcript_22935/m.64448 type:complete len:122 (+) Transcript_22935:119-484(+)|eukprot:CAMPEP_0119127634 /NCGR_PEP_ID=MMETSP1310-20130426/6109_1 /TAXON_ID=464262 /ORGANISM="Genus nov. species nov., Strain RCC2339" /LENGTH=121 /DNA_ID=CAMNT_0007117911 /DNA_START=86 /DNA_END=451 /DNA_ORIENTATION=+
MAPVENQDELAVTYAALILHDDNIPITAEKLDAVCKAAGVSVAGYWPTLFAKLLEKQDIEKLITSVGAAGPAVAPAAGGAAPAAADAPAEEAKEEAKEESEEDIGGGLFGDDDDDDGDFDF